MAGLGRNVLCGVAAGLSGLMLFGGSNSAAPPEVKEPDASVIAAWKKAGADRGWAGLRTSPFGGGFAVGWQKVRLAPGDMPAFTFVALDGNLAELPVVAVPFGVKFDSSIPPYRRIGNEELKALGRQKHLQVLDISDTKVTDAGLEGLAGLKLKYLGTPPAARTDLGLKHYVAAVERPTELNLTYWTVSDAGLEALAGLKLRSLVLREQTMTDVGLRHYLAAIATPEDLDLSVSTQWKVSDAGLKGLAGHKQLRSLRLTGRKITDAGIRELAALTELRVLYLGGTQITDAGLKELAALTKLSSLYVGGTQITDAGLKELSRFKQLQALSLGGLKVTDAGMKELAALGELRELSLGGLPITDAGVKELTALRQLQSLELYGTKITDAGLKDLATLAQLESLNLYNTKVTDTGLKQLAGLNLKRLSIPRTAERESSPARKRARELVEKATELVDRRDTAEPGLTGSERARILGEYNRLISQALGDALAADPACVEAYRVRSRFRRLSGNDPAGAEADLKKAVELAPAQGAPRLELVELALQRKDAALAKRLAAQGFLVRRAELANPSRGLTAGEELARQAAVRRGGGPAKPALDETLALLAFHAEQWDDLVALVRAMAPTPAGHEQGELCLRLVRMAAAYKQPDVAKRLAEEAFRVLQAQAAAAGPRARPDVALVALAFEAERFQDVVALAGRAEAPTKSDEHDLRRMRALSLLALGRETEAQHLLDLPGITKFETDAYRNRDPQAKAAFERRQMEASRPEAKLAKARSQIQRFEEAARQFSFRPPDARARQQLAEACDEAVKADPRSAEALRLRAAARHNWLEDSAGAQDDLHKAIALAPQRSDLHLQLAQLLLAVADQAGSKRIAAQGYALRVAERTALASPPVPDEVLIGLAFHAELWSPVVDLCDQAVKSIPEAEARKPYQRYRGLSLLALGRTADAQPDLKAAEVYQGRVYLTGTETRSYRARNPQLGAREILDLAREGAKAAHISGVPDVVALFDRALQLDPELAEAYAERAQLRWRLRKGAIATWREGGGGREYVSASELQRQTAEKILADCDAAARLGCDAAKLQALREEVLDEGTFVLPFPPPARAKELVQFDGRIHVLVTSPHSNALVHEGEIDRLRALREQRAEMLGQFGDVLGAVEEYSQLIRDTGCEYDPGKPLPKVSEFDKSESSDSVAGGRRAATPPALRRPLSQAARVAGWYFERGALQHQLGRRRAAQLDFAMAIHYEPGRRAAVDEFLQTAGNRRADQAEKKLVERLALTASYAEACGRADEAWRDLQSALAAADASRTDLWDAWFALEDKAIRRNLKWSDQLQQKSDWKPALYAIRKALELQPNSSSVRRRLGEALARSGEPVQALVEFDRGVDRLERLLPGASSKYAPELRRELHRLLLARAGSILDCEPSMRYLAGAVQDLTRAIELLPGEPRAYLLRGRCLLALGKPEHAGQDFSDFVSRLPSSAGEVDQARQWAAGYEVPDQSLAGAARFLRTGDERIRQDDYEDAAADYSTALRLRADDPQLLAARGRARLKLGRAPEAIADLRQAVQKEPTLEHACWLGEAQVAAKDYRGAVGTLTTVIEAAQKLAESSAKPPARAVPEAKPPASAGTEKPGGDVSTEVNPATLAAARKGDARAMFSVAMAHVTARKWEHAKHWLEKVDPATAPHVKLVLADVNKKLAEQAGKAAGSTAAPDRKLAWAYGWRGVARIGLGEFLEAARDLNTARALDQGLASWVRDRRCDLGDAILAAVDARRADEEKLLAHCQTRTRQAAIHNLALEHYDRKRAAELNGRLAKEGDADAMYRLGRAAQFGEGVPHDLDAARQWYTRAAQRGSAKAQAHVAWLQTADQFGAALARVPTSTK